MNEYQDQSLWFEVQYMSVPGYDWVTVADFDTPGEAEAFLDEYDPRFELTMRVKRCSGIAEER